MTSNSFVLTIHSVIRKKHVRFITLLEDARKTEVGERLYNNYSKSVRTHTNCGKLEVPRVFTLSDIFECVCA